MTAALDPSVKPGEIAVEFQTKRTGGTAWLVIEHHETTPPTALLTDLAGKGWVVDPSLPGASPLFGVVEITVCKPGTGMFRSWTPDEARTAMRDARRVLKAHGFSGPLRVRTLTLADMM